MRKINLTLADLLTILTGLAFGFVCFLSLNFLSCGNLEQSITNSAIITVLLITTSLAAKYLKKTKRNFKISFIWEVIFLIVFTVLLCFFSYSAFSHYFYVSSQKVVIQEKLNKGIAQAENMFAEYESYSDNREQQFRSILESVVASKIVKPTDYKNFDFENNGVPDENQIDFKISNLHTELYPLNYSDSIKRNGLKDIALIWFTDAKKNINGWKPIGIVNVVNDLEKNSSEWLNKLIAQSKNLAKNENAEVFSYALPFSDVKKHFTSKGQPSQVSIILSVVAYMLMLLTWFVTERDSRWPGIKLIFRTSRSTINDI